MSFSLETVKSFYEESSNWRWGTQAAEMIKYDIPTVIFKFLKQNIHEACSSSTKEKIEIELNHNDCFLLAPVMLHDSLLLFYRAFYNYLTFRTLYLSGITHWIGIVLPCAKLYLARSLTLILGRQSYRIRDKSSFQNEDIESVLTEIRSCLQLESSSDENNLILRFEIDLKKQVGQVTFSKTNCSLDQEVWDDYESIDLNNSDLNIYPLNNLDYFPDEQNEDNYGFSNYSGFDIDAELKKFKKYFIDEHIKRFNTVLYEQLSVDLLVALSTQLEFYRKLGVKKRSIQKEKFAFMIEELMIPCNVKDNLLLLCKEGFSTWKLFSPDGAYIHDEKDRYL